MSTTNTYLIASLVYYSSWVGCNDDTMRQHWTVKRTYQMHETSFRKRLLHIKLCYHTVLSLCCCMMIYCCW